MKDAAQRAALAEKIRSRSATCGVIGLGFVGTTLVEALMRSGFNVVGVDRVPAVVERCRQRLSTDISGGTVVVASDGALVATADVAFIAVRALPRDRDGFDLEPLWSAAALLQAPRNVPLLCLVSSTVPPGTTSALARRLKSDCGQPRVYVAHAPERLSVGHDWRTLKATPHLVGGTDAEATELGLLMLSTICDTVVTTSAPEVSELSKLLENAFLSVGIGLVGEVTAMAHRLGVPAQDVCAAAASKPFGYFAFYPGPGVGGHCLPNDLLMLAEAGQAVGVSHDLCSATRRVLSQQPELVVERLATLMGRTEGLAGMRLLLVGVGFKPGCADTTDSPASSVACLLLRAGSRLSYLDEQVETFTVDGVVVTRVRAADLASQLFDAAIVLAGDAVVAADTLFSVATVVLDAGGGSVITDFERHPSSHL